MVAHSDVKDVSTHSRLKAAAVGQLTFQLLGRFNTQPPEGGCTHVKTAYFICIVSTHSRLKAAVPSSPILGGTKLFQHTAA